MSSEVAVAYVTLLPSFRGGAAAIERELDKPARGAGRKLGETLAEQATAGLSRSFGRGLGKSLAQAAQAAPGLAKAARPLTDIVAGFRSSEAAASAFTGRLGTVGGALKRATLPLSDFVAGFRSSDAAASAFTGRMGTLGGAASKAATPLRFLGAGLSNAASEAQRAIPHLARFGQTLANGITTGAQRAGSALATFTKVGLAAVAAGLLAASGYGLSAASNLQQANVAFETLLGSQSSAQQFTQQLRQFAKTTPFELPGLTRASQQLLGFGFAADKVIPILTAAGDAAAGLGRGQAGVDSFVRALGQIQAKGRVQGDELLQLSELGINGLQILADTAGTTTVEMQKLIEKGAVPATFAIDALVSGVENGTKKTKSFGGLMEKQALTLAGVFSNLKDAVTIALSDGLEPALPAIAAAITALQPSLTQFATTFGQVLGPTLTQLAQTVVPALANVFAALAPVLNTVVAKIAPLFTSLAPLAVTLAGAIGDIAGPLLDALLPAVDALVPPLTQFAAILGQQLARIIPELAPALLAGAQSFGQVLLAVTPLLPLLSEMVVQVLPYLVEGSKFSSIGIGVLGSAFVGLFQVVISAQQAILGFVTGALAGLLDAVASVAGVVNDDLANAARNGAENIRSFAEKSAANITQVQSTLSTVQSNLNQLAQGYTIPVTIAVRTVKLASDEENRGRAQDYAASRAKATAPITFPKVTVPDFSGGGKSGGSGGGGKSKVTQARDALLQSIAGSFLRDLVKSAPADIRQSIAGLIGQVRSALSGSAETNIVKLLKADSTKLAALAKKRDAILERIADAKALKTSTASAARANITELPKSGPGIVRALAKRLDSIKRFRANLTTLAKRGLPKAFLQQLIDAGLDGIDTAQALVNSSAADFKKIKSLGAQINTESNKLGETSARLMFGAGVNTARGLIAGLASQAKAIENQMTKIGKAMIRSLKKALGIRSPSRPGIAIGYNFANATALGVNRGRKEVDKATGSLFDTALRSRPTPATLTAGLSPRPAAAYTAAPSTTSAPVYAIEHFHLEQHAPRTAAGGTVQSLRDMAFLLGATS